MPLIDAMTCLRRSSISPRSFAPATSEPGLELEDRERREVLRDVARGDAHRERADDRGLADAGLADEERMVLLPALEDLEEAAHLDVAADHRDRSRCPRAARARP